jgi:Fic family protein
LDGLSNILPSPDLFLYFYVRKEAVLSSQIEGTQSSLSDLLLFENEAVPGVPLDDVREVSNYVAALDHGLKRLREGFPLSLRLIREIPDILLRNGRVKKKTPGEFRTTQNWIGGTRPGNAIYVPPPPERLMECLDSFEKFLHDETVTLPLLVQLSLIHVQFETIHPFLDGNGRLGRLLITLLLCARGALQEPLLYLSLYFKTHRSHYYDLLQRVRQDGAWEEWLEFFLEGVESTAKQAAETAVELNRLFAADRKRIQEIGRPALTALRVHEYMQMKPLISIGLAARALNLTVTTVGTALARLESLGIVRETTGRERDRIFAYSHYVEIVSAGTEPIHVS